MPLQPCDECVFVFILNRQAVMVMTESRPVLRGSRGMEAMGMTGQVSYAPFFPP